jgi:LmbE family N-acetylglucosaminyl deacetylase
MRQKILTVVAHPDDEVLGCGGTIAKLTKECEIHTLILGEGITSRFENREDGRKSKEFEKIKISIDKVAEILGIKKTFVFDFPDNMFDSVALLEIVKVVEKVKNEVKPDIVYTHHRNDLNIDHRITYGAVLTACRPKRKETVKEIYSFEILSSTEWNYPNTFSPNLFVDINESIKKKIEALGCYDTELRDFPHPRSEETIKSVAKRWGSAVGLNYAEAFESVRIIK